MNKLKILIGCINFNGYTGSELYYYELAKGLLELDCDVSVCSTLEGGDLSQKAARLGIKTFSLKEPPGYRLGDGKWTINNMGNPAISVPNKLYGNSQVKFDVLCLSHQPIINYMVQLYPDTPILSINHSEVIDVEGPIIHPQIKRYVAVRAEIKDYIVNNYSVDENLIDVIYNPIDDSRFKIENSEKKDKKIVLFVGSLHDLREKMIFDLINKTKENNEEFWMLGRNHGLNLNKILSENQHVKYFDATWDVEKYIHKCDETAGILLGRTTIESWLCGKPAWIYDIDKTGTIHNKTLHQVPEDLDKFKSSVVCQQIKEMLINIKNQK
jgi:hypothetical protein